MKSLRTFGGIVLCVTLVVPARWGMAQTTEPVTDAVWIYDQAFAILRDDDAKNIMSPGASNLTYPDYPPLTAEWVAMEKQDYEAHQHVRDLARQTRTLEQADWGSIMHLNESRNLANELADAAEYQSLILDDQPAAYDTLGDVMHLAHLLKDTPHETLIRLLVGEGIEALAMDRMMVISSGVKITEDTNNTSDLPLATARQWIRLLLDHPDAKTERDQPLKNEPAAGPSMDRILETVRRAQTERDMAAMVLAAHIFYQQHAYWPADMDDLKTELPRVPVDPWGDGKQTLGYVVIKGGLPDGSDRPMVYSRCNSKDGLLYPVNRPYFSYYGQLNGRQVGEFRDVVQWTPTHVNETVAPLP